MDRTERIEIRLTPSEKQEIDTYLDDGEYTDRSQMFRTLAKKEIRGDDTTASIDPEDIINAVDIAVADLTESVEQVNDRLADVEQKLSRSDKLDALARDLYNEMIKVESEDEMRSLEPGLRMPSEEAAIVSTPQIWAEYFSEDLVDIRRALSLAHDYYPDLKYLTTDDGHRRYYVLDPSLSEEQEEDDEGGE